MDPKVHTGLLFGKDYTGHVYLIKITPDFNLFTIIIIFLAYIFIHLLPCLCVNAENWIELGL